MPETNKPELPQIMFHHIVLDWQKVSEDNIQSKTGIYQIYGDSPVYGMNTLLYIGQTNNFERRNKQHVETPDSFIARQNNKSFRFAEVKAQYLDIVESTLIAMHKPSLNSESIQKAKNEFPIYIQNHGERGLLSLEVTNFYFCEMP